MLRMERTPVDIIIHRDAYGAAFAIDWTGIELEGEEHIVTGVAGLKTVMRALFGALENQEDSRLALIGVL